MRFLSLPKNPTLHPLSTHSCLRLKQQLVTVDRGRFHEAAELLYSLKPSLKTKDESNIINVLFVLIFYRV